MDETKVNGMLAALQIQRDQALNNVVILSGDIAVLRKRIQELEAEKEKQPPE